MLKSLARRSRGEVRTPPQMQTLRDALDQPFPAGREWARAAAERLEPELDATTPVRHVAQGWMRLGGGSEAMLVDTLFVLTDDRLGFGQVQIQTTDPNWIPLSSIVAIDLIEGVPYPLEAIEVQFAGGLAIFVGWPDELSAAVLDVLRPEPVEVEPPPAADPAAVQELLSDVPPMPPAPVPADLLAAPLAPAEPPAAEPTAGDGVADRFAPDAEVAAAPPGSPFEAAASSAEDEFFADLEHRGDASTLFSVDAEQLEVPDVPDVPVDEAPVPGPWDDPHIEWPEPLQGCVFLGGHPVHQRRRKNVVVVMQRGGIVIAAGSHGWSVHVPWHRVRRLDVQGADEVKFTHNHRIDHRGSALVVELTDGTFLLVEVRSRRPATVRVGLAPAIAVAGAPTTDLG